MKRLLKYTLAIHFLFFSYCICSYAQDSSKRAQSSRQEVTEKRKEITTAEEERAKLDTPTPVLTHPKSKRITIKFMSDIEAILYIDGERKGRLEKDMPMRLTLAKGDYRVKAVNVLDASDYIALFCKVTRQSNETIVYLPLQDTIKQRKARKKNQEDAAAAALVDKQRKAKPEPVTQNNVKDKVQEKVVSLQNGVVKTVPIPTNYLNNSDSWIISDPNVVSMSENRIDMVVLGMDNAVWHKWSEAGNWSGWDKLGGNFAGAPSVCSMTKGRLDVFVISRDHHLWHNWFLGRWVGWEDLGGDLYSDPACVSWGNNRIDVFAKGSSGSLIHKWFENTWNGWEDLGGEITSAPSVSSWASGRLDVFARGKNNSLIHKWHDHGWSNWEDKGGTLASAPSCVSWGPQRIDIFSKGASSSMIHLWYDGNYGWGTWEDLGGRLSSKPGVTSYTKNKLDCFVLDENNRLLHKKFDQKWIDWNIVSKDNVDIEMVNAGSFSIGKYEVTQAQWVAVMGNNPSHFTACDDCPVETVSWDDIRPFLEKLNKMTGKNYRLPTEAEWLYAAKGGSQTHNYQYAGSGDINYSTWNEGNSSNKTHMVGQLHPNELGIYDMTGNVNEWCAGWYDSTANRRIFRGGDYHDKPGDWLGPYKGYGPSTFRGSDIGFRLALSH